MSDKIEFMELLLQLHKEKQQNVENFQAFHDKHIEVQKMRDQAFKDLEEKQNLEKEQPVNTFQLKNLPPPITNLELPSIKIEEIIDESTTGSLKITEI
jgi:hypothetical protein